MNGNMAFEAQLARKIRPVVRGLDHKIFIYVDTERGRMRVRFFGNPGVCQVPDCNKSFGHSGGVEARTYLSFFERHFRRKREEEVYHFCYDCVGCTGGKTENKPRSRK